MRCESQEMRDIGVEKQVATSPGRLLFLSPAGAGGGLASAGRAFKARRPSSDPHGTREPTLICTNASGPLGTVQSVSWADSLLGRESTVVYLALIYRQQPPGQGLSSDAGA